MNIHEYQAKALLHAYGIPILEGATAYTIEEANEEAVRLTQGKDKFLCVVKAQIHAGGRGKAGGVILCRSQQDVEEAARKLLDSTLITHQTGPQGQRVRKIFLEEGCDIAQEFYLSLVLNRSSGLLNIIASAAGGMDIEEVAHHTPERLLKLEIHPAVGIQAYHGRCVSECFGLSLQHVNQITSLLHALYDAYIHTDASLIEINPLVLTKKEELIALDAKMSFDDNALYRQAAIEALRDEDEEDSSEIEAKKYELNYVRLQGTIGCMVNGAGLAMATMDIIKIHGQEPANFLDVGGGATQERVKAAFQIITRDPSVKAILINIFGGIMRCDIIAQGIIDAVRETALSVPLVVRLQGTNKDLGRDILSKSNLSIIAADDLDEAAAKVVEASKGAH